MNRFILLAGAGVLALAAFPAHADTTTTTVWFVPGPVDLRAGPDDSFPVVDSIPANAHTQLEGCLSGWTWCDISWNEKRGWVSGRDIESINQNKTSYVADLGPTLHVPVVTYDTTAYWDSYYKSEPFYTKRQQFVQWVPASPAPDDMSSQGSASSSTDH